MAPLTVRIYLFISPDFELIYDAKPHWLTPYLGSISSLSGVNLPKHITVPIVVFLVVCCLSHTSLVAICLLLFYLVCLRLLGLPYILPRESQLACTDLLMSIHHHVKPFIFDSNIVSDNISINKI